PLDGIWARAPYLHNGSVPTLRHLLAPSNPESRRPSAFVRGVVSYDTLNVGFDWDVRDAAALVKDAPTAVIFDTGWDGASNRGHDRDIVIDGQRRRLDWSGPEARPHLEDLLEDLKTLRSPPASPGPARRPVRVRPSDRSDDDTNTSKEILSWPGPRKSLPPTSTTTSGE